MLIEKLNPRTTILLLIIFIVIALRLVTHIPEDAHFFSILTPLGALALFGGAYFNGNVKPYVFTLLPLFISDVILCTTVYSDYREGLLYPGWYWVYGAFALMTLWGKLIIKEQKVTTICMAILAATTTHWLVSNLGDCLGAGTTKNFFQLYANRLLSSIFQETNFLLGTLVYSTVMFGSFELAKRKYKGSRLHHTTV
jgi:hypothetical protein